MEVTTGKRRFQGMQKSLFYKGFRHFQRGQRYRILSPGRLPVPPRRRVSKMLQENGLAEAILRFLRRVLYRNMTLMST